MRQTTLPPMGNVGGWSPVCPRFKPVAKRRVAPPLFSPLAWRSATAVVTTTPTAAERVARAAGSGGATPCAAGRLGSPAPARSGYVRVSSALSSRRLCALCRQRPARARDFASEACVDSSITDCCYSACITVVKGVYEALLNAEPLVDPLPADLGRLDAPWARLA